MKTAVVLSFKKSDWVSCQKITQNLKAAYDSAFSNDQIRYFNFEKGMNPYDEYGLVRSMFDFNAERVVFLDHRPHPGKLIHLIDRFYDDDDKIRPELNIHVYGDFTLHLDAWWNLNNVLKKFRVKFICASDAQCELVGKFVNNPDKYITKCPFPVDRNEYYFDQKIRIEGRKKYGLEKDEKVFLYTGRLSYQKKILELVSNFAAVIGKMNGNAKLLLAGEFDDLGVPFLKKKIDFNGYFQYYDRIISDLDKNIRDRICYLGNLNSKELLEMYNLSDCFVSLSVHNDEDFGMSPAEALCSGLPAILTNWGGYSSFKLNNDYCKLIKTSVEKDKIDFDRKEFQKVLLQEYLGGIDNSKRSIMSSTYLSEFSVEACVEKLKSISVSEIVLFDGFANSVKNAAMIIMTDEAVFFEEHNVDKYYNDFYREMYESYF